MAHPGELDTREEGGGIGTALSVQGSILWENSPDQATSAGKISFSNVMGGWPGPGNIALDPMFPGGHRLACRSPCVDAGPPGPYDDLPLLDLSGSNHRLIGSSIDMGAHEAGLQCVPMIQHTGPHTRLSFAARAPLFDPKTIATVFLSLHEAPEGEGLLLPDGTGRRLALVPDVAFQLWLDLPDKHRTTFLRDCRGASTRELRLPTDLPAGLTLFYGGYALDQRTGDFISVSEVSSVTLD